MNGYSLVLIPKSWAFGRWYKHKKTIFALGPLRFVIHRGLGAWKPAEPFEPAINKGQWLHGEARPDRLTDGKEVPPGLTKVL